MKTNPPTETVRAEKWERPHRRGARGVTASPGTAPPCALALLRLSAASCRPGSGGLDEPVGVMQPAEDGGADHLRVGRQAVRVGVRIDRKTVGRLLLWCAKNGSGAFGGPRRGPGIGIREAEGGQDGGSGPSGKVGAAVLRKK
jgi:hypothetical protein